MGRNGSGPKARNAAAGLRWPCLQGKAVGPYGRRQVTDLPLPAGSAASQQRDFLWLLSLVTKKVTGGTTPRGGTPPPALAGKSPPPAGWHPPSPLGGKFPPPAGVAAFRGAQRHISRPRRGHQPGSFWGRVLYRSQVKRRTNFFEECETHVRK